MSSPHTPPNSNSPLPLFSSLNANRKSTDSWNSSNCDGADELEFEWSPEQVRLLSRTLDALPAHLLTPFNGPVPPSNLLDKIARGVTQAKGPIDWPQSLRATRAKIVDLARIRAKEAANESGSDTIAEEDDPDHDILKQTTNTGPKRPLYRQSSMDFMQQSSKLDLKDNRNITRLSHRLQHTERTITTDYRAHTRPPSRASSPPLGSPVRCSQFSRLDRSTSSSTTLNSSASRESRIPRLQRSMSSVSSSSDAYMAPAIDPRVQRIKRSDSFGGQMLYGSLKRAPSFGSISKRSSDAMSMSIGGRDSDATSSDEEEKLRSLKAKKPRVQANSPPPPFRPLPEKKSKLSVKQSHQTIDKSRIPKETPPRRSSRLKANLQRNPSILGPELPLPLPVSSPSMFRPVSRTGTPKSRKLKSTDSPVAIRGAAGATLLHRTPVTPQTTQAKPLRRTHGSRLPQRPPARKISFSSVPTPPSEENVDTGAGLGLGSAFQLH
ncbi:hypothetical protein BKA93DRAFT_827498 [Sparassis latifolia]